jgi:2-desacetyl-2-hydroxyethyl bacteriochlorophyllide A dehydrogenase
MGNVVTFAGPRRLALEEQADPPLQAGQVRVRTLYSGVSAGTELTAYRGSNPYLSKLWDPEARLFRPGSRASQAYPLRGWGYEEAGEVVEAAPGVAEPAVGRIVYGAWGHRSSAVVDAAYAAGRVLPDGLDPLLGIFSHIGSIALNGAHDAASRVGETVAVFGLGVLGQICARLARLAGAHVIGVDLIESRRRLAAEHGMVDEVVDASAGEVAERIKESTGGRGADVSIEASGSTGALNEAIRATAYSSRVVAMGFYQGQAEGLLLGEEFHHNRINLVCSQISGVAPELSGRWDRLRLARTVMRLQAEGRLELRQLVSHVIPAERAAEAFRLLDEQPAQAMQVVLDYTDGEPVRATGASR